MEKLQIIGFIYQVIKDLVIACYRVWKDRKKKSRKGGKKQKRRPARRR